MMPTNTRAVVANIVGARIRQARKERGLTQQDVADPAFTKGYISALERGTVSPSLKALHHIASKLELPISHFVVGVERGIIQEQEGGSFDDPNISGLQDELSYQYDFARMLIRQGDERSIKEALGVLDTSGQSLTLYKSKLPARLLYLPHFLKGIAFLQNGEPERGLAELEMALAATGSDTHARITVQNMCGTAHYIQDRFSSALRSHLQCLHDIESEAIEDIGLHLSIVQNLANDYLELEDMSAALSMLTLGARLADEFKSIEQQANMLWAQALSYRTVHDSQEAKNYTARALHLYERLDEEKGAAAIYLQLGELLMQADKVEDAERALDRAHELFVQNNDPTIGATLYTDYAELCHKSGDLEGAADYAMKGVAGLRELVEAIELPSETSTTSGRQKRSHSISMPQVEILRAYAKVLHISAVIEEERGNRESADRLFDEAKRTALRASLTDIAYAITFSFANALDNRGEYKLASEQYRLAAEIGNGEKRPTLQ